MLKTLEVPSHFRKQPACNNVVDMAVEGGHDALFDLSHGSICQIYVKYVATC